jgi:recombination protein RecA
MGEYKANMASAFALRSQIEAALAHRIPSALTPSPRTIRPVVPTGVEAIDELLGGGLPVGALTEMIGVECSGRTSLALSFVAQVTRTDKVCAWVDVSNALSPESAAACGVDLARLLWVQCGVQTVNTQPVLERTAKEGKESFSVPKKYFVPKPVIKGLHGGGMGGHPRGEAKGMENAVSGLLRPEAIAVRCAEPVKRVKPVREVAEDISGAPNTAKSNVVLRATGKPWSRIEQALRTTDLLLQAGGFGAIVLDMGSLAPEHVSRIPLATWFRYRAAAERTQSSVLLLTQYACSKSSAGLVLRLQNEEAIAQGAVLAGFQRRIEISRQRFEQSDERAKNVVPIRKPPQRAGVAMWRSKTTWAGHR